MRLLNVLSCATLLASASLAMAAAPAAAPAPVTAPSAAHLKATQDLLQAMQAEKMMRTITGTSRYANEAQRTAAYAKLEKVPPAQIYQRLAGPVAKLVSQETALEMTRYYGTPHGQKAVYSMYNTQAVLNLGQKAPALSAAERKELKRPEFVKASQELAAADNGIRHEGFILLQAILKAK
jgi:hypothetical protein